MDKIQVNQTDELNRISCYFQALHKLTILRKANKISDDEFNHLVVVFQKEYGIKVNNQEDNNNGNDNSNKGIKTGNCIN